MIDGEIVCQVWIAQISYFLKAIRFSYKNIYLAEIFDTIYFHVCEKIGA